MLESSSSSSSSSSPSMVMKTPTRRALRAVNGEPRVMSKILGTPRTLEELSTLSDADLLHDAWTSSKKKKKDNSCFEETTASINADARDRLSAAMLRLLNDADEIELADVLAGIGKKRAAALVAKRGGKFESVHHALDLVGLSPKQIENLMIANMKQVLLARGSSS